jgi:hypothetical protein
MFKVECHIEAQGLQSTRKIARIIREKRVGEYGGSVRQGGDEQSPIGQRLGTRDADRGVQRVGNGSEEHIVQ